VLLLVVLLLLLAATTDGEQLCGLALGKLHLADADFHVISIEVEAEGQVEGDEVEVGVGAPESLKDLPSRHGGNPR
jgi:hypothetical protein